MVKSKYKKGRKMDSTLIVMLPPRISDLLNNLDYGKLSDLMGKEIKNKSALCREALYTSLKDYNLYPK